MKHIFFTVGPSQLYPTVKTHIVQALQEEVPSMSHRSNWFKKLVKETKELLHQLLNIPKSHKIFFVASGTEAMERVIQNCVDTNSFHIITGAFGKRFAQTADELAKKATRIELDLDIPANKQQFSIQKDNELLCLTQSETSTGVAIPVELINKIKDDHPDNLLAVDTVSSMPYVNLDYNKCDCVFFSVQKGFGLPAGLGVIIVSPNALKKADWLQKKGVSIGSYHNFPTLMYYEKINETPETPPVLHICLLNRVLKDMVETTITAIRKETEQKAKLLYDFFDSHKTWKPFIKNTEYRSKAVVVANLGDNAENIRVQLQRQGIHVGSGYGEYKGKHIRIANFPSTSIGDMKRLIDHLTQVTNSH